MSLPRLPRLHVRHLAALAAGCSLFSAQAGELYGQIGLPGVGAGYAQPLNDYFGLRADFTTVGTVKRTRTEEGIVYDATLKANRSALLADWFPFGGTFRFSGGATFSQYRLDLLATGAGGTLTIGSTTYTTTASDKLDVAIRYPNTTPYFGIGWGHQSNDGLRFSADIGASFGRATLAAKVSGALANQVSQSDLDAELQQLRDGTAKVRFIPQLSFGIGYSF
jgi:hypothetical protein